MLVIFDCDGVLIDSEIIYSEVDAAMLTRLGHPTRPEEISRRFTGVPHRDLWRILADELGLVTSDALFAAIGDECRRRFAEELAAIPGAAEAVRVAGALGHETCVASSTALPSLRANLATAGLIDLFGDNVFSASQVRRGKPAPDVFLFAASQMGADPADCLVVEDSVAGATAARRAGMAVVGFTGGSHADPELAGRLRDAGAGHIQPTMAGFAAWLAAAGNA
ncbi:MAG: HAD family hydrolase [Alphaproteobacteria bacterium]